jgi:hypothetical protein
MKANLLIPEYGTQKRSLFTPNANHQAPSAIPQYPRSETRASKVLRSLDQLSQKKDHLYSTRILTGGHRTSSQICRYVFEGDQLRGTPIRIGVFAGLRGDDSVGPGAVARFLEDLMALSQLGGESADLCLSCCPYRELRDRDSLVPTKRVHHQSDWMQSFVF